MSLLLLSDVRKSFAGQPVLEGATLQIDPGAKIGLVGRNGGGKTTLLRIIEGKEELDGGQRTLRSGARIGHLEQRPEFPPELSVRDAVREGLSERLALIAAWEETGHAMGHAEGEALQRHMSEHDRLHDRIAAMGGFVSEHELEIVLAGVGLPPALWERPAQTLSGGEKSRLALARELVAGHDLLLLDEPTNHLDLAGIEWLEGFLQSLEGAVLVVSHDRRLLDTAVDAIVELEFGKLTRYPARFTRFVELRAERVEHERREYEKQVEYIRREEEFIRRYRAGQRAAEAQGRQKKLDRLERLQRPRDDVRAPVMRMANAARSGDLVLDVEDVVGGRGEREIFRGARFSVARGDRIGIIGPNGAGKTTLLLTLAARLPPLAGRVRAIGPSVCGFFDQDSAELLESGTPFDEIRRARSNLSDSQIRDHLARFLFRGEQVSQPIAALSGGERARLCLARLVLGDATWLALDEPTNHLDLASRSALEEALGAYPGALVFVSHDRAFLDVLATRIVEVREGLVRVFDGNYSDWRARQEQEQKQRRAQARPAAARPAPRSRAPGKDNKRFEQLERRIFALEEERAGLQRELGAPEAFRDPTRLKAATARLAQVDEELARAYAEWESWA